MDSKLLLVKIITLLYKEASLGDPTISSGDLAKTALSTVKVPDGSGEFDHGRDAIIALKATASWMIEQGPDYTYDHSTLLQRIRVNTGDDEFLYQAFESGLTQDGESDQLKKQCIMLRGELRNAIASVQFKELMKRVYRDVHFDADGFDVKKIAVALQEEVAKFAVGGTDDRIEGMINELNIEDHEAIESYLVQAMTETSEEGIMTLGHQAINRMTGYHNGLRRGETVVLGALQHNYKTGMVLTWFCQLALYNKPFMRDETKRPMLVLISTENDTHMNIMWLYQHLKENETQEAVDMRAINPAEAAKYVSERLHATGYNIRMYRMDPSTTTFQSYVDLITRLEAEGFEIHAVVVDYLNMFNKQGMIQGASGYESRDLWRRMRNFNGPRGTIFISPHQLSPDAKRLVRTDVEDFLKIIANKGYWDGCTTIDQEVDLEIYIHIVKVNGKSYLTVQRGKHRGVNNTPERHLSTVLPFKEVGNIPDDIHGKDISMRYPGADELGLGGSDDKPWHVF